ncbi:C39 family peptidase [Paenibacillus cisolokensis]|uniref:Peptidase C39-like domain-containing protein n=1 Tax=Paenibacillus campinasensis TaxID=66347 RepID=A0ABW9T561_9BACL|nr:C39 family peptidase [Paenibacillus campinasensis]MUG67324.1 hypothetical protein [Paenibacillus campinasensis]
MTGWKTKVSPYQKIITSVLLTIMVVAMIMPASSAHAASKYLSVTATDQEKSQWCWVTAPQIIIKFHLGSAPSQCTLVKRGKNIKDCPNKPGTLSESKRAMTQSGISSGGTTSGTVSFSTIKSDINNNRPMILRKEWKDGKGKKTGVGHLSVIYGFNDNSGNYVSLVKIRNSNSFKSSTSYSKLTNNSDFAWTHTVHNIKK